MGQSEVLVKMKHNDLIPLDIFLHHQLRQRFKLTCACSNDDI